MLSRVRSVAPGAANRVLGSAAVAPVAVKVPLEITALFWVMKVTSTAMGEALADWLDGSPDIGLAVLGTLAAAVAFVLALRRQLAAARYDVVTYWLAVAMVATFGTMAADALHQFLAIPYAVSTAFYAIVLALVFWRWWAAERTLSIHSVDTRRRERFYWATVLATFALGTATGDLTGTSLNLGFLTSGLVFLGAIAVPLVAYRLGASPILTFWTAYVLTRPLGASFADWVDAPTRTSGLGVGTWPVWVVLAALMAGLVLYSRRLSQRR